MNAWLSPSSPSVLLEGWHVVSTLPRRLWDAYVAYLWFYQPNSWVGRLASTFRILAVILVLPVLLLTLLDVTSYVIARTLGVVDDVKASTSDVDATTTGITTERNRTVAAVTLPPRDMRMGIGVGVGMDVDVDVDIGIGAPAHTSEGLASEDDDGDAHGCASETGVGVHACAPASNPGHMRTGTETLARVRMRTADQDMADAVPRAYYFAGEDDLRLAGEGVFSPAVSMPPSPVTPFHPFVEAQISEAEGILLRRRVQGVREDERGHT